MVGLDQDEWTDEVYRKVMDRDFLALTASYANLVSQRKAAKQNNRLQFFLALFAGISTLGVIIQALATLHFFG